MLYGTYLHRAKRYDQALAMYARAEELGLDTPELYYNRGLLEFQRDNLDKAATYAAKAYAGGYTLRHCATNSSRPGSRSRDPRSAAGAVVPRPRRAPRRGAPRSGRRY
jgi:Flp pilus assembly protein TadD